MKYNFQWSRNGSGTSRLLIEAQEFYTIFFAKIYYDQKEAMGVFSGGVLGRFEGKSQKSGSQAYKSEEPSIFDESVVPDKPVGN